MGLFFFGEFKAKTEFFNELKISYNKNVTTYCVVLILQLWCMFLLVYTQEI